MTDKGNLFESLTTRIDEVLRKNLDKNEKLSAVCKLLKENVSYYNWIGFYCQSEKARRAPARPLCWRTN